MNARVPRRRSLVRTFRGFRLVNHIRLCIVATPVRRDSTVGCNSDQIAPCYTEIKVQLITFSGLTYSTLSLLSTVVFLLVATHLNGWKLDKKYGVILMIWYILFISFASLYELNVFGYMNLPECPTLY